MPARRLPSPIAEDDEENFEDKLLEWEREQAMKSMEKEQAGDFFLFLDIFLQTIKIKVNWTKICLKTHQQTPLGHRQILEKVF